MVHKKTQIEYYQFLVLYRPLIRSYSIHHKILSPVATVKHYDLFLRAQIEILWRILFYFILLINLEGMRKDEDAPKHHACMKTKNSKATMKWEKLKGKSQMSSKIERDCVVHVSLCCDDYMLIGIDAKSFS